MGFTMGQHGLLKRAVDVLISRLAKEFPSSTHGPMPTTKTLALNSLLEAMNDAHLKDLFAQESVMPGHPANDPANNTKGERPLLVPDHLSKHIYSEEAEKTLFVKGDTEFVLRTHKAKKNPEEVSLPQWVSANACILMKQINSGKAGIQDVRLPRLYHPIQRLLSIVHDSVHDVIG